MKTTPLTAVLRLLRAQSHLENRFAAELGAIHGLAVNELLLLMHLDRAPGGRLRRVDLAARLDMSQSGVTRMLAPMEKIGCVARAEDPRDGRVGYVVLTPAGRRLAKDGAKTLAQQASTLFGDLWTDQELETLARLLGRLTANLPGPLAG